MSPLRQKMTDLMTVKNYSPRTRDSYLYAMTALVRYYRRAPDQLTQDDLQNYLIYLMKERKVAPATCRLQMNAIRFFYRHILGWHSVRLNMHYPRRPQRIPDLLSRDDLRLILNAPENFKHQVMLKTCYGTGVRVSELVAIKVAHLDGNRQLLHVDQGKGAKDRLVPLSPTLLTLLRQYWVRFHPQLWLFPNQDTLNKLTVSTVQKLLKSAKEKAGVSKRGSVHSLRHAYATHLLEDGLPIHLLQRWLGHQDIRTTMRYIHWVPEYRPCQTRVFDLLA